MKKCICNKLNRSDEISLQYIDFVELILKRDNQTQFHPTQYYLIVSTGDYEEKILVRYCPFCGRQLINEEDFINYIWEVEKR
jgi:hypothetical protein